jgi:hypothetical protein
MFELKAIFIGKNSLGFINGKEYNLYMRINPISLDNNSGSNFIKISCNDYINGNFHRLNCEYSRLESFLTNWEVINYYDHSISTPYDDYIISGFKTSMRENKINKLLEE